MFLKSLFWCSHFFEILFLCKKSPIKSHFIQLIGAFLWQLRKTQNIMKLFWNTKNVAFSYWQVLFLTHKNLSHYWINIKMWTSSKHNSDALVFRSRNMGHFSIGCFHECKISRDFAIICFYENTQLKKYCIWFLRRKMLETRLARSSHKILHSVQILSSNSKILRKVWVECQLSK